MRRSMRSGSEFGAIQRALRPEPVHRTDQPVDVFGRVHRRGREAQPFGAARHGREVDRLDVDPVVRKQPVGDDLGVLRVAHDQRHDVRAVVDDRQPQPLEPQLEDLGLRLVPLPQAAVGLEMRMSLSDGEEPAGDATLTG